MPIPDQETIGEFAANAFLDPSERHRYFGNAAFSWLHALRENRGDQYLLRHSDHFCLAGALDERWARLVLEYCERSRRRILTALPDIAEASGHEPACRVDFRHDR